jgi:hypothetical protein
MDANGFVASAQKAFCAAMGHHVAERSPGRVRCACGEEILRRDGSVTHVCHVVQCALLGHRFEVLGRRHGHDESMCLRCGHPLLRRREPAARFWKPIDVACGVGGHEVHTVTRRGPFTEYACNCGHTFLRREGGLRRIAHPPTCVLSGHQVRALRDVGGGRAEFRCDDCGHPFYLPSSAPAKGRRPSAGRTAGSA